MNGTLSNSIAALGLTVTLLQNGTPIERSLRGGESHAYSIELERGAYLQATFEERGIDIAVTVYGPDEKPIAEIDTSGGKGLELVELIASATGMHRFEVKAFARDAPPARYEVRVDALMTAAEYAAHFEAERAAAVVATKEIARLAVSLNTTIAGSGFDDLQSLERVVGDAKVVALGEATHGTREFFQLKHRILEFLVSEMGFTVFAIEGPAPEAFDINDYVLTGRGNPRHALSALYYWAWNTEEVLELIEWMRRYNADRNHRRKVKFHGFDMTGQPVRAYKVTFDYLRAVDPAVVAKTSAALELFSTTITAGDFDGSPVEQKQAALAAAKTILERFDRRKASWMKKRGPTSWAIARRHARTLVQNLESRIEDTAQSAHRAEFMAENIRWILEQEGPGAKVVAWAHNNHVASEGNSMGAALREMLGKDVVLFGFAFNEGSFQAIKPGRGIQTITVSPAPAATLDATFAATQIPVALLDLRVIPAESPLRKWIDAPRATRDVGATWIDAEAPKYLVRRNAARRYDAVLFVHKTTAARSTPEARLLSSSPRLPAPANADFEQAADDGMPSQWTVLPPVPSKFGFEVATTTDSPCRGTRSGVIRRTPGRHYGEGSGTLLQWIDAKPFQGRKARLRVSLRTRGETNRTFVWMKVHGAFEERREVKSAECKDVEMVREIPASAIVVEYGIAMTGEGETAVDSVALEVVDESIGITIQNERRHVFSPMPPDSTRLTRNSRREGRLDQFRRVEEVDR